jgi:hypothetical protein
MKNEIKDMNPKHPQWNEFCKRLMQSNLNKCNSDGRELKKFLKEFNVTGKWLSENDAHCLCRVQSEIIDLMYIRTSYSQSFIRSMKLVSFR